MSDSGPRPSSANCIPDQRAPSEGSTTGIGSKNPVEPARAKPAQAQKTTDPLARGAEIAHPAYGRGTVISAHDGLVFAAFDNGRSMTVHVRQLVKPE